MNIMSLDVEYNKPSKKTIQIGAAAFHAKSGQLLDRIEMFVDPGEPIDPYITGLCGITNSDVSGAQNIREAYETLKLFHKKHKCFKNPLVWGSGADNDSQAIYREAYPTEALQEANPNFLGYRVLDVKSTFQSIQIFHNKKVSGKLEDVCVRLGLGFEGKPHTALADAMNNFRVWHHIIKSFPGAFK